MATYSAAFKTKMVEKMLPPNNQTAYSLWQETGVSAASLNAWRNKACSGEMMTEKPTSRTWASIEKVSLVAEAENLRGKELGEFMRKNGLHTALIKEWREEMLVALGKPVKKTLKDKMQERRIKKLEKELNRKEKALAETAALLVLKKKLDDFWEEEDESTTTGSDE